MEHKEQKIFLALPWLLESESPGVRYLALRDLLHLPENHPDLLEARASAHEKGPIAAILSRMEPQGYWVEPGPGYNPKYFSSVWSVIMFAQLGASIGMDSRISRACS